MAEFFDDAFFSDVKKLGFGFATQELMDQPKSSNDANVQKYEQIQQRTAPTPTASPIDNKMLIYGGTAVGLVVLVLALK